MLSSMAESIGCDGSLRFAETFGNNDSLAGAGLSLVKQFDGVEQLRNAGCTRNIHSFIEQQSSWKCAPNPSSYDTSDIQKCSLSTAVSKISQEMSSFDSNDKTDMERSGVASTAGTRRLQRKMFSGDIARSVVETSDDRYSVCSAQQAVEPIFSQVSSRYSTKARSESTSAPSTIFGDKRQIIKRLPCKRSWTRAEHLRFLKGLQIYGKGSWKQISTIVESRNPTQIQSHAQKYFLRQKQENKTKRSIHDISFTSLRVFSEMETGLSRSENMSLVDSEMNTNTEQKESDTFPTAASGYRIGLNDSAPFVSFDEYSTASQNNSLKEFSISPGKLSRASSSNRAHGLDIPHQARDNCVASKEGEHIKNDHFDQASTWMLNPTHGYDHFRRGADMAKQTDGQYPVISRSTAHVGVQQPCQVGNESSGTEHCLLPFNFSGFKNSSVDGKTHPNDVTKIAFPDSASGHDSCAHWPATYISSTFAGNLCTNLGGIQNAKSENEKLRDMGIALDLDVSSQRRQCHDSDLGSIRPDVLSTPLFHVTDTESHGHMIENTPMNVHASYPAAGPTPLDSILQSDHASCPRVSPKSLFCSALDDNRTPGNAVFSSLNLPDSVASFGLGACADRLAMNSNHGNSQSLGAGPEGGMPDRFRSSSERYSNANNFCGTSADAVKHLGETSSDQNQRSSQVQLRPHASSEAFMHNSLQTGASLMSPYTFYTQSYHLPSFSDSYGFVLR